SYFALAVLMPRQTLYPRLKAWLRLRVWRPAAMRSLMDQYRVAPDSLMYRLSHVLPHDFGLAPHFLRLHADRGGIRLIQRLNLSGIPAPPGVQGSEHYCRRGLSVRLLHDSAELWRDELVPRHHPVFAAQRSRFVGTDQQFFSFGVAAHPRLLPSTVM